MNAFSLLSHLGPAWFFLYAAPAAGACVLAALPLYFTFPRWRHLLWAGPLSAGLFFFGAWQGLFLALAVNRRILNGQIVSSAVGVDGPGVILGVFVLERQAPLYLGCMALVYGAFFWRARSARFANPGDEVGA